jgi:hypothetical protein
MSCGFTKTDLQNMINIIEVCTQRGAFKAPEMTGIGQLYDKLTSACKDCTKNVKECKDGSCDKETVCEDGSCDKETVCEDGSCEGGLCPVNMVSNCGT